jgi:hypothetical protein
MAQKPLEGNNAGGESPMVGTRLPPATALRLARMAARKRLTPSALIREALTMALDQMEHDTGPPTAA